ncbi:MAG: hypothetical protein JOZ36_15865 [Acidobacteria bacterium]|nr:hypothetical protein [Acidobacteriota bacterium]
MEAPAGTALLGSGPSVFSKVQERTGSHFEPVTAQLISQELSAAPAPFSPPSPALTDVLKPKFEHVANSLSALNARAATVEPASAAESLRNRLQLLDSQFRLIGNNLEETAAKSDPIHLLRLQNDIYQIDEELELLSRVVDQTTSGIRSLLQTQI